MVFKITILALFCSATAVAGNKISPLQEVEATEHPQAESELKKWAFPGIIGGVCLLLFWNNRAQKQPVRDQPKPPEPKQPDQPMEQPANAPQQPPQNPPIITATTIPPMDVGDLYKQVARIYEEKQVRQESSKYALPFTEVDKKELCQPRLSTVELPSAWDHEIAEIVIVADRRIPGEHSYAIFSTLENARNAQTVKDFFAAVEPGMV